MNIFEDLVPEDQQHDKYKAIKNNVLSGQKDILQDWVSGFEDRDGKIIKEFQKTFHSSFWEFYLYAIFKEAKFEIDFEHNRPDFIIKSPRKVYIEAVVSNIKQDGRKENDRTMDDLLSMLDPPWEQEDFFEDLDESIVRHSNAILSKNTKYLHEYQKLSYVDSSAPFVIALGAFDQVNYGNQFYYPMMALLYGNYYDPFLKIYKRKETVNKPGTAVDIPIGLFTDDTYSHISAVIFSASVTIGKLEALSISQNKKISCNFVLNIGYQDEPPHYLFRRVTPDNPEHLDDGLFIFHNPFAKNKLDQKFLGNSHATHVFVQKDNRVVVENKGIALYSRLNMVNFIPDEYINIIVKENSIRFNQREFFFDEGAFSVLDINYENNEICLFSESIKAPIIVDLSEQEVIYLQENDLKEGSRIIGCIVAPQSNFHSNGSRFYAAIEVL